MWSFLAYLRRMRYIYRWQLMKNTRQENLSEHSMDTAAIVHLLGMIRNRRLPHRQPLDLSRLVTLAVYHDCSEIFTGDMPTPLKYANTRLRDAYKALERDAVDRLLDTLPPDFREEYANCFAPANLEEQRFLKAADRISALLKCEEESQQGNGDFRSAQQKIRQSLVEMDMEEIKIFLREFFPPCQMDPDELSLLSGEFQRGHNMTNENGA